MIRTRSLLYLIPLLLLISCASGTPDRERPPTDAESRYTGQNLAGLGNYQATFLIQFEGDSSWLYQVDLRSDGVALEHRLHIEGVDPALNLGDVRMVTQGGESRMSGPGTDGDCLVFPESLDIGPAFILPDQILTPGLVGPLLNEIGKDTVAGIDAERFAMRADTLGEWSDVLVDIWLAEPGNSLMRYDLELTGQDPMFDRGRGRLSGRMIVTSVGPQTIEPVSGCEPDYPIPDSADNLVRLPDFLAFDSPETMEGIAGFYQEILPQSGWTLAEEPEQAGDVIVLSFRQGDRSLRVVIERAEDGAHAELRTEP